MKAPFASRFLAAMCSLLLVPGDGLLYAQQAAQTPEQAPAKLSADQLDSLVAPIALYPDPMLSQTLVASTYPLELIQLHQWLQKNASLKDQALADAVKKQDWDPSIQAMAGLPEVVKLMAENMKWTTELGNAFLAQQSDVMDAAQRMRKKAKDTGNLKSTEQQKVETKVVESKSVIVIEQANPQVVYVPSYNPTVVYGPPVYAYPPIAYPPPGYYAAGMAISFGIGVAMGAFWGGGWGWGCGWHSSNININVNNNFVNHHNTINRGGNRNNIGNTNWQHNPQHRGGAPYGDRATADRFGGTTRGDSLSNRQASARQNIGNSNRPSAGTMDRGGSNRGSSGLGSGASASTMDRSGSRGGDHVGSRDIGGGGGGRSDRSSFSGASNSRGGGGARASSSRGRSSMGGRGGGGGRRR